MRELDPGDGAFRADEIGNAREDRDVFVFINAKVVGRNTAARFHGTGFGNDQRCTADGTAAKVDQVPLAREAVFAGVLAHRRDGDAVFEADAADFKGIEQVHGIFMVPFARAVPIDSAVGCVRHVIVGC